MAEEENDASPEVESPEQPARRGRPPRENTDASDARIAELEQALTSIIAYAKIASGSSHLVPNVTDPVYQAERVLAGN